MPVSSASIGLPGRTTSKLTEENQARSAAADTARRELLSEKSFAAQLQQKLQSSSARKAELKTEVGDFAKENTEGDEDSGGAEVGTHQAHQVEVDVRPGALAVPPLGIRVLRVPQ